jgi:hypothetical protein
LVGGITLLRPIAKWLWVNQEIRINMTKNMTRKGLAFGAGFALIASGLAGVPAQAVGEDGNVRLSPDTGAEYDVRATDAFDLKAGWSDAVEGTGNFLKYLVEAGTGAFKFDLDSNPDATDEIYTVTNGLGVVTTAATGIASSTVSGLTVNTIVTSVAHGLVVGDTIKVAGVTAAASGDDGRINIYAVVATQADSTTFTYTVATSTNAAASGVSAGTITKIASNTGTVVKLFTTAAHSFQTADVVAVSGIVSVTNVNANQTLTDVGTNFIQFTQANAATVVMGDGTDVLAAVQTDGLSSRADINARGLGSYNIVAGDDGTINLHITETSLVAGTTNYVIDSNDIVNAGSDHVLRLTATSDTATTQLKVTAWIDANDNGLIDSTESSSPKRTVNFLRPLDITATSTIRPVTVGENNVTVDVMFTPVLNGNMILRSEGKTASTVDVAIAQVDFTRQGDSTLEESITDGTYSNTTKKFTFTSKNFDNAGWAVTAATKVAPGTNGQSASSKPFIRTIAVSATGVVTATIAESADGTTYTLTPHGLRVGDKVVVTDEDGAQVWESATAVTITSVPTTSSFTYKITSTTAVATTTLTAADNTKEAFYTVDTYLRDKTEPGTVTAQFYFDVVGNVAVAANGSRTAAQTVGAVASYSVGAQVVGASGIAVDGVASATVSAAGSIFKGTTTASAVVIVTDEDGDPVGAGVDITLSATKSSPGTVKVNGTTVGTSATAFYAKTDASGRVTLSIENSSAVAAETVAITASSQGATASKTFTYEDKKYTLHDLADATAANTARARVVASGASYTFNLLAQDQFKQAAGADVRLLVTTEDRTVSQNIVPLTAAGTATVVVADGGLGAGTFTDVKVGFQKLTSGVWATQSGTDAFQDWNNDAAEDDDLAKVVINYDSTAALLTLNANGANFPGSGTADNAALVAVAALKAIDLRNTAGIAGVYTSAQTGTVSGQVTNTFGVAKPGSSVTVSGAGLLFNAGDIWALNSVTLLANATGQFSVTAFASTGGAKVVTATVGSVSKTFTITFTGVAGDATLTVTSPAAVKPASTFQVKAKIADTLGNGVNTAPGFVKVTYSGPGIVFGALPTETDANGELMFSVLLGSNDTGTVSVTVSYDQNADGDYLDAKDQSVTTTTEINATGAASSAAKVNVGSFKGYVALYAKGYKGQKMTAIVAGKWIKVDSLASDFERVVRYTGAGYSITTKIYIDGVQIGDSFTTMTK